jgi:hypothetical protein
MKSIIARATLVAVSICLLVGFTATRLHAGEYFIYQDAIATEWNRSHGSALIFSISATG